MFESSPDQLPHLHANPWKDFLLQKRSLVPKRLGTTVHTYIPSPGYKHIHAFHGAASCLSLTPSTSLLATRAKVVTRLVAKRGEGVLTPPSWCVTCQAGGRCWGCGESRWIGFLIAGCQRPPELGRRCGCQAWVYSRHPINIRLFLSSRQVAPPPSPHRHPDLSGPQPGEAAHPPAVLLSAPPFEK